MSYHAPHSDIVFALTTVGGLAEVLRFPEFSQLDSPTCADAVREAGRFAEQVIAPTNRIGDLEGVRFADGSVTVPAAFATAYQQLRTSGWAAIGHPPEYGGSGVPLGVTLAVRETLISGNLALSMCPFLAGGVIATLLRHGTAQQRERYVPPLASGEWAGTMAMTEPQAGSDVGASTAAAVRGDDGTYRVFGQKIFISYGDHDLTEQIVHLVLARLPGAPAGSKGLSLFLVPKRLIDEHGKLGERNDVAVTGVEHKMGLHGSPTCTLSFGDAGRGAVAELVGGEHDGMRAMFTMMNDARVGVGVQGVALAELATQRAVEFARQREQGRPPGSSEPGPIAEQPDVRRMLLVASATVVAMRAVVHATAEAIERGDHHPDERVRAAARARADLLTPVCKAWCTDRAVEVVSTAMQVFGGMGFIEEAGIAQLYRDVRITPIYEGTNGIQAIDLVQRKLLRDKGAAVQDLLAEARTTVEALGATDPGSAHLLGAAIGLLHGTTEALLERAADPVALLAGASTYLRLFGTVLAGTSLARCVVRGRSASVVDRTWSRSAALLRCFCRYVLPEIHGLTLQVSVDAEELYALPSSELGSA